MSQGVIANHPREPAVCSYEYTYFKMINLKRISICTFLIGPPRSLTI